MVWILNIPNALWFRLVPKAAVLRKGFRRVAGGEGEGVRHLHTHSSTGSRSQAVHPHRAHLAWDCLSPPSSHLLAAVPCAALFSVGTGLDHWG